MRAIYSAEHNLKPVVGKSRTYVLFAAHCSQLELEFVLLMPHDLRAAMREDSSLHAGLMAPTELRPHRSMTEQFVAMSAH